MHLILFTLKQDRFVIMLGRLHHKYMNLIWIKENNWFKFQYYSEKQHSPEYLYL